MYRLLTIWILKDKRCRHHIRSTHRKPTASMVHDHLKFIIVIFSDFNTIYPLSFPYGPKIKFSIHFIIYIPGRIIVFHLNHVCNLKALLQLNGAWWFGRNVVCDTGNAIDLINNSCANFLEEREVELVRLSSHEIGSDDGTEDDDITVRTVISHNSDSFVGIKTSIGLGHFIIDTRVSDFTNEDVVCLASNGDTLRCYLSNNANSDTYEC